MTTAHAPLDAAKIAAAHARMNAQIDADHATAVQKRAQAVLGKPPSIQSLLMAPAAVGPVPLAQSRALALKLDFTGDGKWNASDIPGLQNAITNLSAWNQTTVAPTNVLASANPAGVVIVSWFQQADPAGLDHINVIRNGVVIGTTGPGGLTFSDTPGNGTWVYQVQNVSLSYEGEFSASSTVTVGVVTPPVPGWTDLTPAPGAVVTYVSSSTGNNANPGTQAAPLATIAAGYAKLRDGQPDQLLLKCGDTWNEGISWAKASGSPTNKMVFGSYGTGPRPKIRVNGTAVYGGEQNKKGLLIVDLDLAPVTRGQGTNGLCFFAPWSNVRVEGCSIQGFAVNVVVQEIDANRSSGMEFFRSAMFNAEGGSGHNQNLFLGSCDGTVVDGCSFDRAGRTDISSVPDMFKQNVYMHQSCGPSVFKNNVTCRASASGVQQRSGGVMTNNLAIQNPVNLFQGDQSAVPNTYNYNVCIDSLDIDAANPRGFGHWLNGTAGSTAMNNICAHQDHGTANCEGFQIEGVSSGVVSGNFAYDWHCSPPGQVAWGHCYSFESSGVNFTGNRSAQPRGGVAISGTNGGTNSGNTDFAQGGPVYDLHIEAYMTAKGKAGGLDGFIQGCLANSKQSWDPVFTADGFNHWARGIVGVTQPPIT